MALDVSGRDFFAPLVSKCNFHLGKRRHSLESRALNGPSLVIFVGGRGLTAFNMGLTAIKRGLPSGVTEQCGALSQCRGLGPLFFANQMRLSLKLPLPA